MRRTRVFLTFIITLIMIGLAVAVIRYVRPPLPIEVIKYFPFSKENSLKEWREKIFKGRVEYSIKRADHESFVLATSRGTASALFYKITLDVNKRPVISWKWNAKKFPAKDGVESLKNARQDDFSARVYVIFPAFFFTNSRAIEYIWAEKIKVGTVSPSPYSRNLQLIVVESGAGKEEWVTEERDIYEDYIEAFGDKPRYNVGAIAFMTDADSTKSMAEAFYDEIKIGYKKEER